MEYYIVNGKKYEIEGLLGKGKGGYSYLAFVDKKPVVLKKIHHEPCAYYQFGNKIEAELYDYKRLSEVGITLPKLIDFDKEQEIIIKEYIQGDTVYEQIQRGENVEPLCILVKDMSDTLRAHGLNIDYYPTNFIYSDNKLYYIDYEANNYMHEWSWEEWGIKQWQYKPLLTNS